MESDGSAALLAGSSLIGADFANEGEDQGGNHQSSKEAHPHGTREGGEEGGQRRIGDRWGRFLERR